MNRIEFNVTSPPPPSRDVVDLIARITTDYSFEPERRNEKRHRFTAAVSVVELDDDNKPVGEPWTVLTSTVSPSGIGFVSATQVVAKRLAIELPIPNIPQYVLEVIWSKQVNRFFILGTKIIGRLE